MCYSAQAIEAMVKKDVYLQHALDSIRGKCTYTRSLKLLYTIFIEPTPILYNAYLSEIREQKKQTPSGSAFST